MTSSLISPLTNYFDGISKSYKHDYEIVKSFYEDHNAIFVSQDHLNENILPVIGGVMIALTITYTLSYYILKFILYQQQQGDDVTIIKEEASSSSQNNDNTTRRRNDNIKNDKERILKIRKGSYQMTNLLMNLLLGIVGLYHYYITLTDDDDYVSIEERVVGWLGVETDIGVTVTPGSTIHLLSSMQIGYQLWSLIIGIGWINESIQMICHHIAVIFVTSMSAFFVCGYRYYTPFFYGMVELSSVPLSIMNYFKDNKDLIERYPSFYNNVRIVFAIMFLQLRMVMFIPIDIDFLRLCSMAVNYLLFQQNNILYGIFLLTCSLSSLFLMILQCMWGTVIIKGLIKIFFGNNDNKKSTSSSSRSDSNISDDSITAMKKKKN